MKRLLQIVAASFLMLNFACEGPEGPAGPQGETGPAGQQGPAGEDAQRATVVEFSLDFEPDENGDYAGFSPSLEQLGVVESDVVLAYNLFTVLPEEQIAFWSPLPQTYNIEEGTLTYNYAVATVAAYFYIETGIDLAAMEASRREDFTTEQWIRLVVIPGEYFGENERKSGSSSEYLKSLSYKEVMKKFNLSEKDVKKIQI